MSKKKYQIPGPVRIDLLRLHAQRQAQQIGRHGWRPHKDDLRDLRESLKDARAYRTLARAWRQVGFKVAAVRKLAGRAP
jgi:hypothetical protein